MFGFGMEMFGPSSRMPFHKEYHCFSVSMMPGHERQDVENGGKIILPPSALEHLTRLNTSYPMLFKLTNSKKNRMTHCGVLEFVADEGRCYIPHWMMRNLLLEEGNPVRVQSVSLPVATFSKFEPQTSRFLDITNPKAVLENALRNFACLTAGDMVAIRYNDRIYELRVLETKPGNAVSIIECDMDVDFAPPPDYVEPTRVQPREELVSTAETSTADQPTGYFKAFAGSGNRLDGKAVEVLSSILSSIPVRRGIPDYEYKVGEIQFFRNIRPPSSTTKTSKDDNGFKVFEGTGMSLRPTPALLQVPGNNPTPSTPPTTTPFLDTDPIPLNSLGHTPFPSPPVNFDDDDDDDDSYYDWQSIETEVIAEPASITFHSNSSHSSHLDPPTPPAQGDDLD